MVAAFCLGTCFDMLFAWMPTYFHDNYPDSQVLFLCTIFYKTILSYCSVAGVRIKRRRE